MKSSQERYEKAMEVALDPAYPEFPKTTLNITYMFENQLNLKLIFKHIYHT